MSGVVKSVLPAALSIIGGIVAGPWGAAIGAVVGSAIVSTAFKPKGPEAPEQQAQTVGLDLGEVGREAIFGTVLTGGSLGNAWNWGGKYGTDWEAQDILLADHQCDGLVGYYVNDEYFDYTGNGAVPGFKNQLYVKWFDGSETQPVDGDASAFGGYGPSDNVAGVAHAVMAYKSDASDAKDPVFSNGRPRFKFLVRGKRCYQARKDSTVAGGSGPHRWNDPSTYEWTDNPIDCRYNWVRGIYACERVDQPGQLLIGRGLSAAEAPPERVAAAANLCDELVPLAAGGTEKRYRIGAVINALEQFDSIEGKFASACAGLLLQPEGSIEIEPGHAKAPVAYITDADLIVGKPVTFSDFRSEADDEWCNTVIPRYVEPEQRWADHGAPIRRRTADLIADGGPREKTLSLGYVTSGTQAQRCGEIARRLGRLWRTGSITLGPRFSELEEGDWIVWTSARRTKGLPVMFRIEAYSLNEARQITPQLREIDTTVYSYTTADEIAPGATAEAQTPPGGYGEPDPGTWALTGVSIGPGGATLPGLTFTGAVEDMYVTTVRFEYRSHNPANGIDDNWLDGGLAAPIATSRTISGVEGGTTYEGGVSYGFPGGKFGPRLILGPVTAGSLAFPVNSQDAIANSFPLGLVMSSSSAGSIVINNHSRRYTDGHADVAVTGATIASGLAPGDFRAIAYDDLDRTGGSVAYHLHEDDLDARVSPDHPGRHYLGYVFIPTAGSPPSSGGGATPPGGYCVTIDTPILMADRSLKAAGDINVGDQVFTRHEASLQWGVYPVEAIEIADSEDVWEATIDGRTLRGTGDHLVYTSGWIAMREIGSPTASGRIVKMTVTGAHTYVSNGILSHNIKIPQNDAS